MRVLFKNTASQVRQSSSYEWHNQNSRFPEDPFAERLGLVSQWSGSTASSGTRRPLLASNTLRVYALLCVAPQISPCVQELLRNHLL